MKTYKKTACSLFFMVMGCGQEANTQLVQIASDLTDQGWKNRIHLFIDCSAEQLKAWIKQYPVLLTKQDEAGNTLLILLALTFSPRPYKDEVSYHGSDQNKLKKKEEKKNREVCKEKFIFGVSCLDSQACAHTNAYGKTIVDYAIEFEKEDNTLITLINAPAVLPKFHKMIVRKYYAIFKNRGLKKLKNQYNYDFFLLSMVALAYAYQDESAAQLIFNHAMKFLQKRGNLTDKPAIRRRLLLRLINPHLDEYPIKPYDLYLYVNWLYEKVKIPEANEVLHNLCIWSYTYLYDLGQVPFFGSPSSEQPQKRLPKSPVIDAESTLGRIKNSLTLCYNFIHYLFYRRDG